MSKTIHEIKYTDDGIDFTVGIDEENRVFVYALQGGEWVDAGWNKICLVDALKVAMKEVVELSNKRLPILPTRKPTIRSSLTEQDEQ